MTDKILKDDIIDNIKLFSDLKTQTEYSTVSKELNSKFKDLTFSKFYTNLKNYKNKLKICNVNSIFSLTSRTKKKDQNQNLKEFDISKIMLALQRMKERDDESKEKRDHPYTEKLKHSIPIYTLLKDRIRNKERQRIRYFNKYNNINKSVTPEVGRYDPSYEIIKKRSHQVIFSLKNYKEFNNEFKQENNIKNKKLKNNTVINTRNRSQKVFKKYLNNIQMENQSKIIHSANSQKTQILSYKIMKDKINKEDNTNNNIFYNTAISKKTKKKFETRNNKKDVHCIRFETYYQRNQLTNPTFYKTETDFNTSSFRTTKYKKKIIFGKIYSNKINYFEELAAKKKDIPSICFYRPDYSSILNKTKNVIFDRKKSLKNNFKINELKKILGSYYVPRDYQLFSLLNDKKELNKEKID